MEEVLHHGFVHYCNASGGRRILSADVPAEENRNSEGSEVTGSNRVLTGAPIVSVCRCKAGNNNGIGRFSSSQDTVPGITDALYSGYCGEPRTQLLGELLHAFAFISNRRSAGMADDDAVPVEAKVLTHELLQAAHQKRRTEEHQQ